MVIADGDTANGCSDSAGRVVGMRVLYQDSGPLAVCRLSQRSNCSLVQLRRN